jgi:hypothetical protein
MTIDAENSSPSKSGFVWLWIIAFLGTLLLSLGLAWISSHAQGFDGFFSFWCVLLVASGLLWGGWRLLKAEKPPGWLAALIVGAALLRLAAGAFWFAALPLWGHGTPAERAGYIMADAYARDQAAWKLAESGKSLWTAFRNQRQVDQYGGLLFVSALIYRYFGGDAHQPLLMIVITAAFSALGVLFTWALARRAWGLAAGWLGAWILALYPEAVLLGSSQMREAFTIPLTAVAFYGLLRFRNEHSPASLAWISIPILLYLPFSPLFAALLTAALVLTAILTSGTLDSSLLRKRRFWLVLGALTVLILAGLWLALKQFTPAGMNNPIEMLSWWLRKSAHLQAYLAEHASGWIQKIFGNTPEWTHLPLLLAYGVVQPFLPAALVVGSQAPIWRWVTLWRSLGWTILLAFLIYAPLLVWRRPRDHGFTRALIFVIWAVILIASFRGGADMWDNPRYRATYAGLQAVLAAWVLIQGRREADPWLRRALLGVGAILIWFLPWYLRRYTAFEWSVIDPFKTLGLGIFTASLLALWDWTISNHKRSQLNSNEPANKDNAII